MQESSSHPPATPQSAGIHLVLSWLAVGIPLAWGIWQTLQKSLELFRIHAIH